ncbi:MAG: hypothetical protein Q7R41_12590, partial [Phycisphaerales bacterium]|nr:hypothetical protein [Phycisphaerales bacterium]
ERKRRAMTPRSRLGFGFARLHLASLFAAYTLTISGCTGRANVQVVPLGTQRINTSGPLISELTPRECYYWTNDDGDLRVAMRSRKRSLFDRRLDQEFVLSFVFDDVPAAASCDYRFHRRTARCRTHASIFHTRSASLNGIATVWDYGKPTLRGRFRFYAKIQTHHLLAGWRDDGNALYTGEFEAVADRRRGEAILAETEGTGMERWAVPERDTRPRSTENPAPPPHVAPDKP